MQLGIDLGTSNSSVAGYRDGPARPVPHPGRDRGDAIVIHIDRRGNRTVGVRAYDQAIMAPENVAQGFKRLMGTATPLHFAASGQEMLPEAASAELLRTLVGYALVEAGERPVEGAVVTIPAAFNQLQSEATLEAAAQAGLDRVGLLQEPVAAAMAAMAGVQRAQRPVPDLRPGRRHVRPGAGAGQRRHRQRGGARGRQHAGRPRLRPADPDELVTPWLRRHLRAAGRLHGRPAYDRLVRVARLAAERAKVELSPGRRPRSARPTTWSGWRTSAASRSTWTCRSPAPGWTRW